MWEKGCTNSTNLRWEAWSRWSDLWETIWNIKLVVNTKSVFGLPWGKQIGLEHGEKNLIRCERWLAALGMSMLTDSMIFFGTLLLVNEWITTVFVEQSLALPRFSCHKWPLFNIDKCFNSEEEDALPSFSHIWRPGPVGWVCEAPCPTHPCSTLLHTLQRTLTAVQCKLYPLYLKQACCPGCRRRPFPIQLH